MLSTARNQYAYFEGLEKTIKGGLSFYIVILLIGLTISVAGYQNTLSTMQAWGLPAILIVAGASAGLFFGLFKGSGKIRWLAEIHIWMDQRFFGFLKKSNDIIFHRLISALEPEERGRAVVMEAGEQGALAQTIFSRLAGDPHLFEALLRTGIFRKWIWYWIMIYGTSVFIMLTVETLIRGAVGPDPQIRTFFSAYWALALIHLGVTVLLGYRLIGMTRKTMDTMVRVHKSEIAIMLREKITALQVPVHISL